MNIMIRLVAVLVAVLMAELAELHAQDRALGAKMERIRVEVASTEKEIEKLRGEFNALVKQRKELEGSIGKLKADDQRIQKKINTLSKEVEKHQETVKSSEARLGVEHAKLQARLKALYTSAAPSMSPLLLWKAEGPEIERFAVYVRSIRAKDKARFDVVKGLVDELLRHRQKLTDAIDEGRRLQSEVATKRAEAEGKVREFKTLTEQISVKQKNAQRSLLKLREESERLEAVMASITGGPSEAAPDEEEEEGEGPKPERTSAVEPAVTDKDSTDADEPGAVRASISLAPNGLFSPGVALSSPVAGKVLQKFGKVKVTDFADMIFSKGLEFSSAPGATVHAVMNGKVAFAGTMPAYETVVVLDHGGRSYSLYGRLGSSAVKKGEMVAKDTIIGTTSAPDKKGRNFYFEVRKNGNPVDPEGVLKRVSR